MELPYIIVKPKNKLEEMIAKVARLFDFSGSQAVECTSLGDFLRFLGCAPTEKEIKTICAATEFEEKQFRGNISIQKLMEYVSELIISDKMKPANTKILIEAFQALDKDNKGYLEPEYFKELMMTEGEPLTEQEVDEMMKVAIDHRSGVIPYEFFMGKLIHKDFTAYELGSEIRKQREAKLEEERLKREARQRMFAKAS